MAWQLIYTSAPRGLLSGQSGFCTVARSADLREALAQRLEQISSYHYLRVAEAATANRNPTVHAFRILDLRGSKYYVLTRIVPCGLDFTARTNHLAHHLVFQPGELAQLPNPAAILRNWTGWLSAWQGDPRILPDAALDSFAAPAKPCLPAQTWLRVTGDAGRAAGLLESECVRGCYLVCPQGVEQQVLDMFGESLQLLNLNGQYALRPWRHSFTTFLQAEENPGDFQWRACQEGTPAHQQALQRSAPLIPLRGVRVPNNSLVKVAREGLKPPAPASPAPSPQSQLSLQSQPSGKRSPRPVTDVSLWEKPVKHAEKPPLLDLNFSLKFTSMARVAVFAAVLLALVAMKHWLRKKPVQNQSVPPTEAIQTVPAAAREIPHPSAQASRTDLLMGDGPTYILTTSNLLNFALPIQSISRLQNLLHRFDHMDTLPAAFRLSVNTNEWDFPAADRLAVNGMEAHTLSAHTGNGLEFAFDYASWLNDSNAPVTVTATFSNPPSAFSIQFNFASPGDGDPFRLLVVDEINPPAPLHLGLPWFASNQAGLTQRLFGDFILMGRRRFQFQPFVSTKDGTNDLYKDWPAEDMPSAGSELDFVTDRQRLSARLRPLQAKADSVAQKLSEQAKLAGLDIAVGKDLEVTNALLASFSTFSADPSPAEFVKYLNRLKKQAGLKDWPRVQDDDQDEDLAQKFQKIYDLCVQKNPDARAVLTVGNTNYFSSVWRSLKDMEKVRLEKRRLQDNIDTLNARRELIPDTLDKAAYVGLFIIDPPKPGLEMIRFAGP